MHYITFNALFLLSSDTFKRTKMVIKNFLEKNVGSPFCGDPGQLPTLSMPESGPD